MKTGLQKIMNAWKVEKETGRSIECFLFKINGITFDYAGRFFAFVYDDAKTFSVNYDYDSFETMLDTVVKETGKTPKQMLKELNETDVFLDTASIIPNGGQS